MDSPTLLSSCARATTAAEASFRIDYPLAPSRATRVLALDDAAREAVAAAAAGDWNNARFYALASPGEEDPADAVESIAPGAVPDSPLVEGLDGVDAVLMVAASDAGAEAAAVLGAACREHGVMTAGLALSGPEERDAEIEALAALRPWARILLVPADRDDLIELLRAIRA
jgi:hypothetical protein